MSILLTKLFLTYDRGSARSLTAFLNHEILFSHFHFKVDDSVELRKGIENIVYFTRTKHKVNLDPQMIIEWLEWAIVYFKWKTETSVMNAVHTFLYKTEFVIPTQFEVGGNYKWSIMRTLL